MANRYYLVKVIITSTDAENRELTAYDDIDVATRKFHEGFNTIGGGPKKISMLLLDLNLNTLKKEVWMAPLPEPEPTPEPETPEDGEDEEPKE